MLKCIQHTPVYTLLARCTLTTHHEVNNILHVVKKSDPLESSHLTLTVQHLRASPNEDGALFHDYQQSILSLLSEDLHEHRFYEHKRNLVYFVTPDFEMLDEFVLESLAHAQSCIP